LKGTRKLFVCTTCEADFQTKEQLVTHFKQGKHDSSFKNQLNNFNKNKSGGKLGATPASTGFNISSSDEGLQIIHSTFTKSLQSGNKDTRCQFHQNFMRDFVIRKCFVAFFSSCS